MESRAKPQVQPEQGAPQADEDQAASQEAPLGIDEAGRDQRRQQEHPRVGGADAARAQTGQNRRQPEPEAVDVDERAEKTLSR